MRRTAALGGSLLLVLATSSLAVIGAADDMPMADHPIVGSWIIDSSPEDPNDLLSPATFGPAGTFIGLFSFGAPLGAWAATGERSVNITAVSPFGPPDNGSGMFTIRASVEVSEDGQTFAGTFTLEAPIGPGGEPLGPFPAGQLGPGEMTARRITAEPMGEPVGPLPAFFEEEEVEAVAMPPPEDIEPLGRVVEGGRVEMPGSGFAMTFPDDWTVEMVDPDPDVFTAAPGDAWEALRAYDPEHREACSMFVAVAAEGQRSVEESGVGTGGAVEPYWSTEDGQPILLVRPPRIETESGGGMGIIAPHERLRSSDPRLEHDVLYAVVCETDRDRDLDAIHQSVEFLPGDG